MPMKLSNIPQFARNANRLREILTILSRYGLADWISRLELDIVKGLFKAKDGQGLADLSHERRIRLAITELGTTFIKFGQMLSTRADLVGPRLADELSELQSSAPADPPHVVRVTVSAELGQPIDELFDQFDDAPLASASIGQVHRARLPNGESVVVKVQHPGIEDRVRTDLDILVGLADLAEKYIPELRRYRPRSTAAEFQRILLRELDFGREERNLSQFRTNFASNPTVHFPKPNAELSTGRVLTMEYLDGIRLTEPQRLRDLGYDLEDLARRGAELFLDMIFRDGFYHADPHPGNFLVLPGGIIGMLDCGMVGRVDESMREHIEDMLLAVANRDPLQLTTIITRIGSVPPALDQAALCNDVTELVSYHGSRPLEQLNLGQALTDMTEIVRRYHIVLPTGIALLIKVLVMLEGTSRLLSPQFNLTELIKGYQKKMLWRRLSPQRHIQKIRRLIQEWQYFGEVLPRTVVDVLQQVQTGRFDVHLEHKRLEPAVNRLVFGMLTSALFMGSALILRANVPPTIYDVSVLGALGYGFSIVLAMRLLWAIRKSGHLDQKK
jgi:ubiquinone biosynthesis protein